MSILIVGAGPSGLTLATELTRRGIPCSIIDKASGPAPLHQSRALAFNARSQLILNASGVTQQIIEHGHTIKRVRLCWHGQPRKTITILEDSDQTSPKLITIRQGEVERLLMEQLESRGITVQWNTKLLEFNQTDTDVTAVLKTADDSVVKETASYLVGCDGAHSVVRGQGGYSFHGESDEQTWTLADIEIGSNDYAHLVNADLRPGQAFGTLPLADNVVRIIHNGPDILKTHPVTKSQKVRDVHWESEFNVSYRMVKRFHRGRTFLCGDAAHIHSPVGGRGMNLGIEDAAALAFLIETGKQEDYSASRIPVAKKILGLTKNQTHQLHSKSSISSMAKKYGPAFLSIPFIRNMMIKSLLGFDTPEPTWLADTQAVQDS